MSIQLYMYNYYILYIIFKAIHTQNKYRHVLYCNYMYYSLLYSVLLYSSVWHLFVYESHSK